MKVKEYIKFKKILKRYKQTNQICFSSHSFGMTTNDLRYLASKGLIDIVPYVNGDPNCRVTLTNKAFSYNSDRQEDNIRFWTPIVISIVALLRPEIIKLINYILSLINKP